MAKINVQMDFFEGSPVPVHQLSKLFEKMVDLFAHVSAHVGAPIPKENWMSIDITGGSIGGKCISDRDVDAICVNKFNEVMHNIMDYAQSIGVRHTDIDPLLLHKYALLTKEVTDNDLIKLGIGENGSYRTYRIIKQHGEKIIEEVPVTKSYFGSAQGIIYGFTPGADNPFFQLRELANDELIHCTIDDRLYDQVVEALTERHGVVFVEGTFKENIIYGKIDNIRISAVYQAPKFSQKDFDSIFGCDPTFTGALTTTEYIRQRRES